MNEQKTVTRNEMRNLHIGESRIFRLENRKTISSVKVQANQLKKEEDYHFSVRTDYANNSVCITRIR